MGMVCSECVFAHAVRFKNAKPLFYCRRNAPVEDVDNHDYGIYVPAQYWCGEFRDDTTGMSLVDYVKETYDL